MAGVAAKPRAAIDARIAEGLDTDYDFYKVINKKPGHNIYELAKDMGWSSGKVYGSVQRLEKEGLLHTEKGYTRRKIHIKSSSRLLARVLHKRRAGRVRQPGILKGSICASHLFHLPFPCINA